MNREELRCGNFVSFKNALGVTRSLKVASIEIDGVKLFTGATVDVFGICTETIGYDEISPIKITEEVLLSCGFEKRGSCIFKNKISITYDRPTKEYRLDFNFSGVCDIEYLHQLQNLFYALTGTELNIENYEQV